MGNSPLSGAFKPANSRTPFYEVLLTHPTIYALSPQIKTTPLKITAHEFNNLGLRHAKLKVNSLKRGTVFPGHFYDSIDCYEVHYWL
jgi:hypothetical protein